MVGKAGVEPARIPRSNPPGLKSGAATNFATFRGTSKLVPNARLERAHLSAPDPKSGASTKFRQLGIKEGRRVFCHGGGCALMAVEFAGG